MKKKIKVIVFIVTMIALVFAVPIFINESYKKGGYVTLWDAADVLNFYGVVLAFGASTILGIVAIKQSTLANSLAKKMLDMEEKDRLPLVDINCVKEEISDINKVGIANSYKLMLNHTQFWFDESGINPESDYVNVFKLTNVSNTNIISLKITDVQLQTTFDNGDKIKTDIEQYETSLPISLIKSETCFFLCFRCRYSKSYKYVNG